MKRVLMLASVASMIDQFNMPNIALLQKLGYEVDVACNFIEGNTCSDARVAELKQNCRTCTCTVIRSISHGISSIWDKT